MSRYATMCVCGIKLIIRFSGMYYVGYLAALAGNAAVVVTRGLVTTHHTWLILFEVAGDIP